MSSAKTPKTMISMRKRILFFSKPRCGEIRASATTVLRAPDAPSRVVLALFIFHLQSHLWLKPGPSGLNPHRKGADQRAKMNFQLHLHFFTVLAVHLDTHFLQSQVNKQTNRKYCPRLCLRHLKRSQQTRN